MRLCGSTRPSPSSSSTLNPCIQPVTGHVNVCTGVSGMSISMSWSDPSIIIMWSISGGDGGTRNGPARTTTSWRAESIRMRIWGTESREGIARTVSKPANNIEWLLKKIGR